MKDIHETLLYIAYNLENQNQTITIDAIKQSMVLMQRNEFDLEKVITWLIVNGYLAKRSEKEFSLTETGQKESFKINKIRAKDDFNRFINRSTNSTPYLDYCEEIYGYRMYLFNMMDKQQLDYLFNSISISKNDTILDLGCGAGCILNKLIKKYGSHGIGIDQLNKAVVENASEMITYIDGDIDALSNYSLNPTITLSVDSLYFSSDLDGLIKTLKCIENNRMYLFYSQYIFDETKKDSTILHHDNTRIASVLVKNDMHYRVVNYSTNEYSLYENALKVLPKYKKAFELEGNSDLYEAKLRENRSGKELYDKGRARRYLYIIE